MSSILHAASTLVLDLLFPPHCLGCSRRGRWFCERCHAASVLAGRPDACTACLRITPMPGRLCRAHRQHYGVTGLVSYGDYRAPHLAEAIRAMKYDGVFAVIPEVIHYGWERWQPLATAGLCAIVPIPLAADRLRERGFNQAEHIARALGERLALPVITRLVRTRSTPHQVGLGRAERRANVSGAFVWTGPPPPPSVLLVDDVVTTGATLHAAASTIRRHGAHTIWGASLAVER